MIGPKRFTQAEREEIARQARSLDERIDVLEDTAREVCRKVDECTTAYELRLNEYLAESGLDKYLEVASVSKPFTPMTLDVTASEADFYPRSQQVADMVPALIGPEQDDMLKAMRIEYKAEVRALVSSTQQELFDSYRQLFELTRIEQILDEQGENSQALIYVADPDKNQLLRIKTGFSEQTMPLPSESNIVRDYAFTEGVYTELKLRASEEKADLYVVHNTSKRVPGDVILRTAWNVLARMYKEAHADVIVLEGSRKEIIEILQNHNKGEREDETTPSDEVPKEVFCADESVWNAAVKRAGYLGQIQIREDNDDSE